MTLMTLIMLFIIIILAPLAIKDGLGCVNPVNLWHDYVEAFVCNNSHNERTIVRNNYTEESDRS